MKTYLNQFTPGLRRVSRVNMVSRLRVGVRVSVKIMAGLVLVIWWDRTSRHGLSGVISRVFDV